MNDYKTVNYRPMRKGEIYFKKFARMNGKSLRTLLLHRFMQHYGYDKGEVTAKAIVDDIVRLIERYFVVCRPDDSSLCLRYGQMAWLAVPIEERPQRGKSIADTRTKPVILTFLCDEDIETLKNGFSSRELRMRRMVRWLDEAFDQGALLTQLDLAILLNVCDSVVSSYVNDYQRTTGRILPTRGNIQDISGAITHKREIIALYLQGYLTPTIAKRTNHEKESVDRYIRDYETVKLLTKVSVDPEVIGRMARLSKKVVQQYLDLIEEPDNEAKTVVKERKP
jgi:hypothetical protein